MGDAAVILVIDNYDSFTFNLVQLIGRIDEEVVVKRNDRISVEEIQALGPRGIVISPGPGRPEHAGVTVDVIRRLGPSTPVFGVCLGHQGIGLTFGASVVHAPSLMHGKTSQVFHDGSSLYRGVSSPFTATRYHSLVVSGEGLPPDLEVTARTEDGVIMGLKHRRYPIEGVQFHPESILTEKGEQIVRNWLEGTKRS
jgi:anthranilate synthase/aminodeoxychorismate synthase-like glutamine amidotransferase